MIDFFKKNAPHARIGRAYNLIGMDSDILFQDKPPFTNDFICDIIVNKKG